MRIAVLAYNLIGAGGLSVGKNIVSLLPKIGPKHTYLMLVPKGLGYDTHKGRENVTVSEFARMNFFKRAQFESVILPKLIRRFQPDWVFGIGNIGLSKPSCKQAILFQQPHLLYNAKHFGKMAFLERIKISILVKNRLRKCLKHTNIVFCQTPVARERFSRNLKYPIDQIEIMPNAVSEFAKIDKTTVDMPEIFKGKKYFNLFFLTSYYAHKNMEALIDIFSRYPDALKNVRCIITILPDQHPNAPKFLVDIKKYKLDEHIVNVGLLKQNELAGYFYNSDVLLFPTLLESFSGTYLEAMHFGLPILTSDLDFAHYICGDAAVYFDPWDTASIMDKILAVKNSHSLRQKLVIKGQKRLSSFFGSWEDIVADALSKLEAIQ